MGLKNLYLDDLIFLFFNFEVPGQASISKYLNEGFGVDSGFVNSPFIHTMVKV